MKILLVIMLLGSLLGCHFLPSKPVKQLRATQPKQLHLSPTPPSTPSPKIEQLTLANEKPIENSVVYAFSQAELEIALTAKPQFFDFKNPPKKRPVKTKKSIPQKFIKHTFPNVIYRGCQESQTDLWCRIRRGYQFQVQDNNAIQEALSRFAGAQSFFNRVTQRAHPYLYYIVREIEAQKLPLELALLPVVESAYRVTAVSPKAAGGLWQFIPTTGERFGLVQNKWYDARYDVVASTRAALKYLKQLNKAFKGDWLLALAAYNWGQKNVSNAIAKNVAAGKPTDFWSLKLPAETRQYVPRLIAVAEIVAHPQDYGITLKSIPSQPYFKQIALDVPMDLATVAELADMTLADFKYYNPMYLQETIIPTDKQCFTLPIRHLDRLRQNSANLSTPETSIPTVKEVFQLSADKLSGVMRTYRVKRGDTLWQIAQRYKIKLPTLQQLNGSKGRHLKIGQTIKLSKMPVSKPLKALLIPDQAIIGTQSHRVRRRETLWQIAKQYKTTVPLLRTLNNLQGQSLKVGHVLTIPGSTQAVTAEISIPDTRKKVIHTVQVGENLWSIAYAYQVAVEELVNWNRLQKHAILRSGQKLTIWQDG